MSKLQDQPRPAIPAGKPEAESSRGAIMALTAALLGWMFDGFEMGLFSLIGRSAIIDLSKFPAAATPEIKAQQDATVALWFGVVIALFLIGAATGGVLFGWLGDRIGRVRAMSLSVLTYALFTGFCGFASETWQVGLLRFIASLGMGGEWALGVALVMEVWPNRSRAFMAGLIGAAANVGYLLVPVAGWMAKAVLPENSWPEWRILMLAGALPALLTFFIRIFVPESHRWEQEKAEGRTSHWANKDLLGVLVGGAGPGLIIAMGLMNSLPLAVRVLGTILGVVIAAVGYLWPALGYLQRAVDAGQLQPSDRGQTIRRMLLGACLSGVALVATWGSAQWAPGWAEQLAPKTVKNAKEWTQACSAFGAVVGTILAALACDRFGRRSTYAAICVLSMASLVWLYLGNREYGNSFLFAAFLVGVCTAAFYGWLPLYLPELFRTPVRATGQGFGFNFGRILAAIGVLQTGQLVGFFKSDVVVFGQQMKAWPIACATISSAYLLGLIVIAFAPETKGKPLPE